MKKILNTVWELASCNRMKSLYWRCGAMLFAGCSYEIIDILTKWDSHNTITIVTGLVLGEITKYLNKKYL